MQNDTPPRGRMTPVLGGFALALAGLLALAAPTQAQEGDSPWAIGIQNMVNTYGPSLRYEVNDKLSAQAILSAGTLFGLTGRGNYDFHQAEKYDVFGYGSVSFWRWGGSGVFASESVVGYGVGGGVEVDFPELLEDDEFPPIFATFELGFGTAAFNNYTFNGFRYGGSLHYRF